MTVPQPHAGPVPDPEAGVASFLGRHWPLIATLAVLIPVAAWYVHVYGDQMNPDGIAYLNAAEYYANLEFKKAINGYWSPLISWILTPFAALNLDLPVTFKILNASMALGVITYVLIKRRHDMGGFLNQAVLVLLSVAFGLLLLQWSTLAITPDLLSGVMALVVIIAARRFFESPTVRNSTVLGLSLAGLFLAKSIGFFLAGMALAYLAFKIFRKDQPGKARRNLGIAAAIFAVISGTWIALISLKYGFLTLSTAGKYNSNLAGPHHPQHPQMAADNLLKPPYADSTWAWDDPSYLSLPGWDKSDHVVYLINTIIGTLGKSLALFFGFSPLVIIALAFLVHRAFRGYLQPQLALGLLVATLGAYATFFIEGRYLWLAAIPCVVLLLLGATLKRSHQPAALIVAGIVMVTAVLPLATKAQEGANLNNGFSRFKDVGIAMRDHLAPHSRVVTDHSVQYEVCYHARVSCYGSLRNADDASLREAKRAGVEYLMVEKPISSDGLDYVATVTSTERMCHVNRMDSSAKCKKLSMTIYKIR